MKIIYFGTSSFGIPSLNALKQSSHQIVHVFTQPPRPAGRGRKVRPSDVALWSEQNSIQCSAVQNVNSAENIAILKSLKADLLVVIAFGQKISPQVIELFPAGAINLHGSILPEYRGAAPVNRAVMDGRKQTGVTIITLARQMDAGDMLAKAYIDIGPQETAGQVHDNLAQTAAPLLVRTVDQIENGTASYQPQDHSKATLAPKLKKQDGNIDWTEPAELIHNHIRGLNPWPGAFSFLVTASNGHKIKLNINSAEVIDTQPPNADPGVLDNDLNVSCGTGKLRLVQLKPAGKKAMSFEALCNGYDIKPGDYFTSDDRTE